MPARLKLEDNEPFDVALRRFKRACEKAGVLSEGSPSGVLREANNFAKAVRVRPGQAVKRHLKKVSRETKKFERLY